ncbi:MAG: hypothetical protein H8E44_34305 [Planctomycetes bacterium]|nr:hypothetical protein [Planctomycetota bacterium]MBL7037097.1 hypothetical protein [Pirellulaceae bacterium]
MEVSVEVDWMAEVLRGGMTSVALVILLMAGIILTVERLLGLRRRFVSPVGLPDTVAPLWHQNEFTSIFDACEKQPSTLGRMIEFPVHHREADPGSLIAGAQDVAAREMKKQSQKTYSVAVVAALAPLLGFLLIERWTIAAENFQASLEAGRVFREQKQFNSALRELDVARSQAANDTERGLASTGFLYRFVLARTDSTIIRSS